MFKELLQDALDALNQIRNTRLSGRFKTSYELAHAIETALRENKDRQQGESNGN